MVGDYYRDKWSYIYEPVHQRPTYQPYSIQPSPLTQPSALGQPAGGLAPVITRQEFDDLKRDVLEMKELLKRAKEYDERTGQTDCEQDEKLAVLRKVAELVGVDLKDVLG